MSKDSGGIVPFSTLLDTYESKNYQKAYELTKRVKFSSNESGILKQLKVEICTQLALSCLKNYKLNDALKYAQMNREMQPKPGFPFSFEKADLLIAFIKLYLGSFEEVSNSLKNTLAKPETAYLYYYYILSQLYATKGVEYKTIKEFQSAYKDYLETLTANKKNYLFFVFFLQKDDSKNAVKYLNLIEPESHQQIKNYEFLKQTFSKKKTTGDVLVTKSLYRIIAKCQLSDVDFSYLENFPKLKEKQTEKLTAQNLKSYQKELTALIEKQKTMSDEGLAFFKPHNKFNFIVFNQVASLADEKNSKLALRIVNIYRENFFLVPESFGLYIHVLLHANIDKPDNFPQNVLYFFQQNKHQITDFKFQTLTFSLLSFLFAYQADHFKKMELMSSLEALHPNLLSTSILSYILRSANKMTQPEIHLLKIITHPLFSEHSQIVINHLQHFWNMMHKEAEDSHFVDIFSMFQTKKATPERKLYNSVIETAMDALLKEQQFDKKAKDVLALYSSIYDHVIEINVPEHKIQKFIEKYESLLDYFKQNKVGSDYYKEYMQLSRSKEAVVINALLDKNDFAALEAKYIDFLKNKKEEILQDVVIEHIEDLASQEEIETCFELIFILFKGLYVEYPQDFSKYLEPLAKKIYEDSILDDDDFEKMLVHIIKNKKQALSPKFIGELVALYFDQLDESCLFDISKEYILYASELKKANQAGDVSQKLIENCTKIIEQEVISKNRTTDLKFLILAKELMNLDSPTIEFYKNTLEVILKRDLKKIKTIFEKYNSEKKLDQLSEFLLNHANLGGRVEGQVITLFLDYYFIENNSKSIEKAKDFCIKYFEHQIGAEQFLFINYLLSSQVIAKHTSFILYFFEKYVSKYTKSRISAVEAVQFTQYLQFIMNCCKTVENFVYDKALVERCLKSVKNSLVLKNKKLFVTENYEELADFFAGKPTKTKKAVQKEIFK